MALLDPRSEVVVDDDGWVWLRPHRASLRRNQVLAWALLVGALATGAAGIAFLDPLPGGVLAAASFVVALGLLRAGTRGAHTRAGVCEVGLLLQSGARVIQAGWPAITAMRGEHRGQRVRLVVATDQGPTHRTHATFERRAVAEWLERAADAARAAGRTVEPERDGFGLAS